MINKPIKVNDSFIINSLRNCGYNNYTAIADIIDNSIEPEVGSSFVRVDFETEGSGKEKATVKSILIILLRNCQLIKNSWISLSISLDFRQDFNIFFVIRC